MASTQEQASTLGATPETPAITPQVLDQVTHNLLEAPTAILSQLDEVQREMDSLKDELTLLRRRDDTLNFYMHRLDEELRLAARLQQDFLPKSLPKLGNVRFHTLYRPAGYVSGDLYDVMRLDERHVGFYIADAVGHGMPAALLTMFIKHALETKQILQGGYRLLEPGESLAKHNEALLDQHLSQATFATALYGMIDVQTLVVKLACAGHPAPIVLHADGSHEMAQTEGSLLGIFPDEHFANTSIQLHPGDRMLLFTDGIEVAFGDGNSDDDALRWRRELLARSSMNTQDLMAEFAQSVDSESGSLEPRDDLTMVMLEVGPE